MSRFEGDTRKILKLCAALLAPMLLIVGWFVAALRPWLRPPVAKVSTIPSVAAMVVGAEQVVFDTSNGCEKTDVPDSPARAFRDDQGMVHLMSSHFIARAMIGSSLNRLTHDCHVVYRSPQDPDPSHFEDNNWLFSFYSEDGRRIAALVHSEFDGDEIPGMCATLDDPNNCWWNTVTYAESRDGGYSFATPQPPRNLVAALPYRYVVGNRAGAYGFHWPTNILKVDGFYYTMINVWPYKAQQFGPCLMRTSNVFDPASWRGWSGTGFTVQFVDPYREAIEAPEDHVCQPVLAGTASSLVGHPQNGTYIVTQFAPKDVFGPAGFYVQASRDLIHWSNPTLVFKIDDLQMSGDPDRWTYEYVSLLDPDSADRNFSTVSDSPYLYYVRSEAHDPYKRSLMRRQIRLQFGEQKQGVASELRDGRLDTRREPDSAAPASTLAAAAGRELLPRKDLKFGGEMR